MENSSSFDNLIFSPYYEMAPGHCSFTSAETLVLDWLKAHPSDRSYPDLMWDSSLSLAECFEAIDNLVELGVLRWR